MPVVYFTILQSEFIQSKTKTPCGALRLLFCLLRKTPRLNKTLFNYETLYRQ